MSGWSKGVVSLLTVFMVTGCANSTMKTEMERKDRKIKSLNSELGLLREKNGQIARERNNYRDKYQSRQGEIDAVKTAELRSRQLIRSQESRIAEMKRRPAASASKSTKRSSNTAQSSGSSAKGKYHLRIISLPKNSHNQKVVQQIASHLRSKGIQSVVPRESGKFFVVDIGHFESIRTEQTRNLKKQLRSMKYRGIRQFKDAIYVPY